MQFVLSSLLNGVTYGLLLFMLSSGLTLIFSMMSILNFAHAAFFMLGAYFAYQISVAIGFWPALLIAPLLVGVLGALVERYGLRKAHRFGPVAELLFTFGLSFLAVEAVQLIWGKAAVDYRVPASLQGALFTFYGTTYPIYKAFMMAVSVGMLLALYAGPRLHPHRARSSRPRSRGPRWCRRSATTCRASSRWCSAAERRSPASPASSAATRWSPSRAWPMRWGPSSSWWWWWAAWDRSPARSWPRC